MNAVAINIIRSDERFTKVVDGHIEAYGRKDALAMLNDMANELTDDSDNVSLAKVENQLKRIGESS